MSGRIRFFRQHTMETCGASCALMILDYYRKVQYPTRKQEMKLYSLYRSRVFKGITPAALADCLSKNDLQVTLLHSSPAFLDNRDGYFPEDLFRDFLAEYRQRLRECAHRITLETLCDINCDLLRQALDAGKQIILECIIPGNADGIHHQTLHWVVVYGYQGEDFLICDPLSSKITLTAQELERYMDTPVGKICVVLSGT